MSNLSINSMSMRDWPLSCRYSLMLFDRLAVRVADEVGTPSDRTLHWALGVLPSGEYEIAGAWPESFHHGMAWDKVFDELKIRGGERVEFVVASGLPVPELEIRKAYPNASLLSLSTARNRHDGSSIVRARTRSKAMPAGTVRTALRAEAISLDLRRQVLLALARHGTFSVPADATAYVVSSLSRAQQRVRGAAGSAELIARNRPDTSRRRSGSSRPIQRPSPE